MPADMVDKALSWERSPRCPKVKSLGRIRLEMSTWSLQACAYCSAVIDADARLSAT
jgi:hypothetical protein